MRNTLRDKISYYYNRIFFHHSRDYNYIHESKSLTDKPKNNNGDIPILDLEASLISLENNRSNRNWKYYMNKVISCCLGR